MFTRMLRALHLTRGEPDRHAIFDADIDPTITRWRAQRQESIEAQERAQTTDWRSVTLRDRIGTPQERVDERE